MKMLVSLCLEEGDDPAAELSLIIDQGEQITLTQIAAQRHIEIPLNTPLTINVATALPV